MTDWEFVFDGVVGFLTSPMWNIPIVSFIEKHCIVFDTSDENVSILKEVHKEYGSLVEELLTSYLKDVGISEEQFVTACEAGYTCDDKTKVTDRSIFEQVWAGEDFDLFRSIMVKKNLDLELQALRMIQERNGIVPDVLRPGDKGTESKTRKPSKSSSESEEDKVMKEVIKLSEEEYRKERERKKDIERMEKTLALSSREESERLFQMAEEELRNMERMVSLTLRLEENVAKEKHKATENLTSKSKQNKSKSNVTNPVKDKSKSASSSAGKDGNKTSSSSSRRTEISKSDKTTKSAREPNSVPVSSQAPTKTTTKPTTQVKNQTKALKPDTPADAAKNWLNSALEEANTSSTAVVTSTKDDDKTSMEEQIVERARYMRMQKEKLLNLKKQERTKRLNIFEDVAPKRPMSSRVARRVTMGTENEKLPANQVDEEQQKKLQLRRALAARLKKEVINAE